MMFNLKIVLVAPRIAANVGNIARTCQALSAELHLVRPLGFFLDDAEVRRASVGFWHEVSPTIHRDANEFWNAMTVFSDASFYFVEKDGTGIYSDVIYPAKTVLIFGNEEEGVDPLFWSSPRRPAVGSVQIPMQATRCLNLATSVGIAGFEVLRQWRLGAREQFEGAFVNPKTQLDLSVLPSAM